MTEIKNELEEFEGLLETNFDPLDFGNGLLLATNHKDELEFDIATSIKKLKFDIQECDKRMSTIAANNYEGLVSKFSKIEMSKTLMDDKVNPSIDRVNYSFQRIQKEIIEPYDEAIKINEALKKLHLTLELLRGASFFMFLVQQLEDLEKLNESDENENAKYLVRLAKLHINIQQLYKSETQNGTFIKEGNSNLMSIKLVREYQPTQISKINYLENQCSNLIINEIDHTSTFNAGNVTLQNNLIALFVLNESMFYQVFEKSTISKHVQSSINQLTRSLQTPRNFIVIIKEIKSSSNDLLDKLNQILLKCNISHLISQTDNSKNLFEKIIKHFEIESLSYYYWKKLSFRFKKNIVATMARGGPIAKNLKIYYDGIKDSIKNNFSGEERDLLLDAIEMIKGSK